MISIRFTTPDGIIFDKSHGDIEVSGAFGGYRKLDDEEGYFFYTDKFHISYEEKVKFESRVHELIRLSKSFEEKI
jgi:hypothetical protein